MSRSPFSSDKADGQKSLRSPRSRGGKGDVHVPSSLMPIATMHHLILLLLFSSLQPIGLFHAPLPRGTITLYTACALLSSFREMMTGDAELAEKAP